MHKFTPFQKRSVLSKRSMYVLGAVLLLGIAAILFFLSDQFGSFQLEYTVKAFSASEKTIQVDVRITRGSFAKDSDFSFVRGNVSLSKLKCFDSENKSVSFKEKDGIINIPVIPQDAKYVTLSYTAQAGISGKGGLQGCVYDDLVTFGGENVLLMPYLDEAELENISDVIGRITVKADIPEGWISVMPFSKSDSRGSAAVIKAPQWLDIFNLGKSCFSFGKMEKVSLESEKGNVNLYVDRAYLDSFNVDTGDAISRVYSYFAELFGEGLDGYSIVLFRKGTDNSPAILGGVGGKSLGLSLNEKKADDWRKLTHSLYHAFFDSRVGASNLRYPPNLWLYRGLATYYENMALSALPEKLGSSLGLNPVSGLQELYDRYLYFRLKEPGIFTLSPVFEESMEGGQAEFYYYTQAPLVVQTAEKLSESRSGKKNNLLRYLLDNAGEDRVNIANLMVNSVGESEELIRSYLSGEKVLPSPGGISSNTKPETIINHLNKYEYLLYTWFSSISSSYPAEEVVLLNPLKVLQLTESRKLKFSDENTEKLVNDYSPTLFLLLRQYALRADVCGIKDLQDPLLKFKLCSDPENIKKWQKFIKDKGLNKIEDEK